jgi:hypothetical protein
MFVRAIPAATAWPSLIEMGVKKVTELGHA